MAPTKTASNIGFAPPSIVTLGPKVWSRFLIRRFQCDPDALNTQLPLPIEADEVFKFGIWPQPLPREDVPQLFQRFLTLGSYPNGNYTPEARYSDCDLWSAEDYEVSPKTGDGKLEKKTGEKKKLQFNLYKRVIYRIPESRYWLFDELEPYFFYNNCPHIEKSAKIFNDVSDDLNVEIVDWRCLEKWESLDAEAFQKAQDVTLSGLINCALPETLALLFSMLHLAVWQDVGYEKKSVIIERLRNAIRDAIVGFTKSPVFSEIEDGHQLANTVGFAFGTSTQIIERVGMRSMTERPCWLIPDLPNKVVIVERSEECKAAMRILHITGEMFWDCAYPEIFQPDFVYPTKEDIQQAAALLARSANNVASALAQRTEGHLKTFKPLRRKRSRSIEI